MTDPAPDWSSTPCGLLALRVDGTVTAVNPALLAWTGRSAGQVEGSAFTELLSAGGRLYWETHLSPLLRVERRVDEVSLDLLGADGPMPVLLSAVVIGEGPTAQVQVALSSARERRRFERELVQARRTAEASAQRVRALQAATAALSRSAAVDAVAHALVSTVRDSFGATEVQVWVEPPGGEAVVAGDGQAQKPPVPETAGPVEQRDGAVLVALRAGSGARGVLRLLPDSAPGAEPLELEVLAGIGRQAEVALERAQLFEQSRRMAHDLQHALLGVPARQDERYGLGALYRPGVEGLEVGGDWYDAFTTRPGRLTVVIGDVVGRGLPAAIAMGQLRSAVRAVAEPGSDPGRVLGRLDRFVEQVPAAAVATLTYAELDLDSGCLQYACAGHPPPLLLAADGTSRYLWEGRSTPLGVAAADDRSAHADHQLAPGDRLLLYTDGLVERRDRGLDEQLDRMQVLADTCCRAGLTEGLEQLTQAMLADEQGRDDVCAILLCWEPDGEGRP